MTTAARVFAATAAFFALIGGLYAITSTEAAGTSMLLAALVLGGLLGSYLTLVSRRFPVPPEDRDDGSLADTATEVGWFPAASIWPFVAGAGAVMTATGLVLGWWLSLAGGLLLASGVVGYALESRRSA